MSQIQEFQMMHLYRDKCDQRSNKMWKLLNNEKYVQNFHHKIATHLEQSVRMTVIICKSYSILSLNQAGTSLYLITWRNVGSVLHK